MKVTTKTYYAIKALSYLADRSAEQRTRVRDIASAQGLPEKYLEQILLRLKEVGVVRSRQGVDGGYSLARPPSEVTLGEVIRTMDGPLAPVPCVSKRAHSKCEQCRDEESCEMRPVWGKVRDAIAGILDNTTLADIQRQPGPLRQETQPIMFHI